jgi:exoribonuclease R
VLVKSLGAQALLRRHKYPGAIKIERFQAFMKKIGMPLEISKDTRVQDTLNSVLAKEGVKQTVKDIIKYETISLL